MYGCQSISMQFLCIQCILVVDMTCGPSVNIFVYFGECLTYIMLFSSLFITRKYSSLFYREWREKHHVTRSVVMRPVMSNSMCQ